MFFETIGIGDTFHNRLNNRIEEVQYFSERQCKWRRLRMAEAENGFSVPEIELIIKASTIDGRRKGACIFCQEYFMDLYLLAGAYFLLLTYNIIPDDHFTLTFYSPLSPSRAEDHLTEDHHSWHEEATCWLQVLQKLCNKHFLNITKLILLTWTPW